jgi:membrane-associated phospholipid phosphatase
MGIMPDAYVASMPSMVTAFVAIFSGLLAFVGWLQRHPALDHSGTITSVPPTPAEQELV